MALTVRYCDCDLATGLNDGTSEANAWQSLSDFAAGYAAGQHIYFKQTATRHSEATVSLTTSASATGPIICEGYKTTIGDGGDSGETNYFQLSSIIDCTTGSGLEFRFIDWEGDPGGNTLYLWDLSAAVTGVLYRCRIKNTRTTSTVPLVSLDDEGFAIGCTFIPGTGQTAVEVADAGVCIFCRIDLSGSSTNGILITHGALQYQYVICNMILGTGTGKGIFSTNYTDASAGKNRIIYGNSIYNVSEGIEFKGVISLSRSAQDLIFGNVIWNCATDGISNLGSNTSGVTIMYNAVGDCTSDRYSGWGDNPTGIGDVTLTVDPFNDAANWDFRLNSTTGGGLELQDTLVPDINLDGGDLNQQHYGAVQAIAAAAGGTILSQMMHHAA